LLKLLSRRPAEGAKRPARHLLRIDGPERVFARTSFLFHKHGKIEARPSCRAFYFCRRADAPQVGLFFSAGPVRGRIFNSVRLVGKKDVLGQSIADGNVTEGLTYKRFRNCRMRNNYLPDKQMSNIELLVSCNQLSAFTKPAI
jgi:hypothetical protein